MLRRWKTPKNETETPTQLIHRYGTPHVLTALETRIFPFFSCNDVVEITGAQSTGKSELLYHFMARCVLPSEWNNIDIGGIDTPVILISNGKLFDAARLAEILERRLAVLQATSDINIEEIREFVFKRLRFVFCFYCRNSAEFILALNKLNKHIAERKKRYMIMVDDMAKFYLEDKRRIRLQAAFTDHLENVFKLFFNISRKFECPIIVTRCRLYKHRPIDRMAHGMNWRRLVTWELELTKEARDEGTYVVLTNHESGSKKLCCIQDDGFNFLHDINA